jgi:hypothetical protein
VMGCPITSRIEAVQHGQEYTVEQNQEKKEEEIGSKVPSSLLRACPQ